jgi:outer membrane receptor protein involved in Fe transport
MRGMLGVRLGNGWNLESTARITRWERFEIADAMSYSPPNLAMDERMATIELRSSWLRLQHDERWTHDVYTLLKPDPTSYPVVPFQFYRYGFNLRERTSRALINANLGPHRLGFGAETTAWWSTSNLWSPDSTFSDVASWAEVRTRDWGAFAEDQVNLSNDLQLTSGLRIDDIAESSLRASPRVALNWRPSERTFTLLSYSGGYRPPTYLERFQRDTFVAPSDDLAPETIHAVEAQWRYRDGAAHELSLGAFANRSNNLIWRLPLPPDQQKQNFIDWRTGASPDPGPQYELRNLDNPTLVLGIEAGGRLAIPQHNLTLWANTTIQRYRMDNPVRFYSPGFEFPLNSGQVYYRYDYTVPRDGNGPPPWKVNLGADWARGHWFATAAGRLVGGRTAYDIGHTRLFSNAEPALGRVPSYAVADVGFGWRSDAESRCAVRLSVMDVFDSGHNETLRTTVDSLKLSNESQYTSDLGRMVAVAANWEF